MKKHPMKWSSLLLGLIALLLALGQATGLLPFDTGYSGEKAALVQTVEAYGDHALATKSKKTATPRPAASSAPKEKAALTPTPVPRDPIIDPQSIADYLFANGELPDNFITKKEAQALGWDSSRNDVSDVAPGMSIGGDYFGNYEGLLPKAKGRSYYECDCYYTSGRRNVTRIIFSSDGLVYYTEDHYATFTEMHPSVITGN